MVRPSVKQLGKYEWRPVALTAAELESVTGVSRRMQIDWRNRGLLPRQGTKAERYSVRQVAEVLVLQRLRPKLRHELDEMLAHARRVAPLVLWYVLFEYKAWHFIGSPKERATFDREMAEKDAELYEQCREITGVPKTWELHTYSFCAWDGESWHLASNLQDELLNRRSEVQVAVNHFAIGDLLSEKFPGSLYEVRLRSAQHRKQ